MDPNSMMMMKRKRNQRSERKESQLLILINNWQNPLDLLLLLKSIKLFILLNI